MIDNETGDVINGTDISNITSSELSLPESSTNDLIRRIKRQSYIEKRTCSSAFQLELFMIPICIAMIPVALVSLLFCVCFCGPKDQRGQVPEKIMGVRLSQKRKNPDDNEDYEIYKKPSIISSNNPSIKITMNDDDELDYKDGYVQRKDSKKLRFATNVSFIEPIRRSSSVSCLEGLNHATRLNIIYQNACNSGDNDDTALPRLKKTRFSDSVDILGDNDDSRPVNGRQQSEMVPIRKPAIIQRSISVI